MFIWGPEISFISCLQSKWRTCGLSKEGSGLPRAAPVSQEAASLNQGWGGSPGGGEGGKARLSVALGYCPDPDSLGTEWWDDRLHSRGGSKAWDPVPPSKRKKAPLVSGILPLKVA